MKKPIYAILSVYDKTGILDLADAFIQAGIHIISSGGTARHLQAHGKPVETVESITGFAEILEGRVKTLHPKIAGGILYRRSSSEHCQVAQKENLPDIAYVICNLYPFENVIRNPETTQEEAIENIDIGGPTLIRAGAKNHQDVIVVVEPADYPRVIEKLTNRQGFTTSERLEMAAKAFARTAFYDSIIFHYLNPATISDTEFLTLPLRQMSELRYGENPHQKAFYYQKAGHRETLDYRQIHGKELSYNNLVDLQAALQIIRESEEPAAVIIKHTNPCGFAQAESIQNAFIKAREGDPLSAFGGIIALNRPVDTDIAQLINDFFNECLLAPGYCEEALSILKQKKNRRLLLWEHNESPWALEFKDIGAGFLAQTPDFNYPEFNQLELVSGEPLEESRLRDLYFAIRVVKHVKSNAIVLVNNQQLIGIGAGQTSRVDAVKIALRKCSENGHPIEGTILASDAFFPFRDNIDFCAPYKLAAIIQPGGSARDEEVIEAARSYHLTMYLSHVRHFKH